jgi:DNA/RNA-binding domain of Phe-tRNA-synthetase-like protein
VSERRRPFDVHVADALADVIRPLAAAWESLSNRVRPPELDAALAEAASAMRRQPPPAEITAAVRAMYRRAGLDPTKVRPSSESLLRRVRRGEPLPVVNPLVDIINWSSVESQLPFGLYDAAAVQGPVTLRPGREGEEYAGIRKDVVHLSGRPMLADTAGAFGNPTSDSARTMVTAGTTSVVVVIFAPVALTAEASAAMEHVGRRILQFCT